MRAAGGHLQADKPGEFHCERCSARCSRSPTKEIEYGHKRGCPERPAELERWVSGDPYEAADDPVAVNEQLATDGGEPSGDD